MIFRRRLEIDVGELKPVGFAGLLVSDRIRFRKHGPVLPRSNFFFFFGCTLIGNGRASVDHRGASQFSTTQESFEGMNKRTLICDLTIIFEGKTCLIDVFPPLFRPSY